MTNYLYNYYLKNLNWSVIPVGNNKRPLVNWGKYSKEKPTIKEWKKWSKEVDIKGIAVVTGKISRITVIDIDPRNGGSNLIFKNLQNACSRTGGGGWHYFFEYDPEISNGTIIAPGIEVKNDGGLITLPPSFHPNGNKYEWVNGYAPWLDIKSENFNILPIPENIKIMCKRHLQDKSAGIQFERVSEGNRNNEATRNFGILFNKLGAENKSLIWDTGVAWNNRNTPPLPEKELISVFNSISKRHNEKSQSQSIYTSDFPTFGDDKVITLSEFLNKEYPKANWIVDDLIPQNGITCISGAPKVGKSILTLYIALRISRGNELFDTYPTLKSKILYISKDEPEFLTNSRLKSFVGDNQVLDENFYFSSFNDIYFDNRKFSEGILSYALQKGIKVIIIDSFRRIFKGDENSSQIINEVQQNLKLLTNAGLTVIFIHHHGKEGFFSKKGGDKLRGSSDILAMVDSLLMLEKVADKRIKIDQAAIRQKEPIRPFVIEITNDPCLDIKYLGEVDEETTKKEDTKEYILSLLADDTPRIQKEILEILKTQYAVGETTIKMSIKELFETKLILKNDKNQYYLNKNEQNILIGEEKIL
jgi:archaellum biogenesis ATPase FlaH